MVKKRNTLVLGILLVGIILSMNFVFSAYELSNAKYTRYYGGNNFYGVSDDINKDFCNKGQDFFIQISPLGCDPSVVRTDLLEEQNVPVFCPLSAVQVNPLIKVNAIENIIFRGENSEYVQDIGFHPAKAALGDENNLNSPVLNNIGYVVIVLNEQENASNIPDYVSGNLTATLEYDIENAFGIGNAEFSLPELNDNEFENKKDSYGFWNARGFIRAENIGDNSAILSIYDGTGKLNRFQLEKGETSGKLYLPGFDCLAGLKVTLAGLEYPDTKARFNINGELVELAEGESFLNGRCELQKISKRGIVQDVSLSCEEDDEGLFSNRNFKLSLSPKISLKVGDSEEETFVIGDKITELGNGEKSLYVGYIGEDENGEFIIPAVSTADTSEEFKDTIFYKTTIPNSIKAAESNTGNFYSNLLKTFLVGTGRFITGSGQYFFTGDFMLDKRHIGGDINNYEWGNGIIETTIKTMMNGLDKSVVFTGIAYPDNSELSENVEELYESAKQDYVTVISDFSKLKFPEEDEKTFGVKAFEKLIELSYNLNQRADTLEYCNEFKENYFDEYKETSKSICENTVKLANSEISNANLLINGELKNIDFIGVFEPDLEDYSAQISIKNPYGQEVPVILSKNDKLNMMYVIGEEDEQVYVVDNVILDSKISSDVIDTIYLKFDNGDWYWTYPGEKWVKVSNSKIERGDGKIDYGFPENIRKLRNRLNDLTGDNINKLQNGEELINNYNGYKKYSNDYIKLVSLDEEHAILEVNLEAERGIGSTITTFGENRISSRKVLKKGEVVSFGSEYTFQLTDINLNKQARVKITPRVDNEETEVNFSFKIGIEKRAIDLSPDEIKNRIDSLNSTINDWNEKSEELGKVVKGLKGACLVAGASLTVKNFFANIGGEGIARQEQMQYWEERCANEISNTESKFYQEYNKEKLEKHIKPKIEDCYSHYNDEIEESIDIRLDLMNNQEEVLEKCKNSNDVSVEKNWLGTETINTKELTECYVDDSYKDNIVDCINELGSDLDIGDLNANDFVKGGKNKVGYIDSSFSLSDLKELELNCKMLDTSISNDDRNLIKKNIKTKLESIYTLKQSEINSKNSQEQAKSDGLENVDYSVHKTKDSQIIYYSNGIAGDNNGYGGLSQGALVHMFEYNSNVYLLELEESVPGERYTIKNIYDSSTHKKLNEDDASEKIIINNIKKDLIIEKVDASSYRNEYKDAEISFYETEPYKGMPAIVPFDLKNGWYVYVEQTIPIGSSMQSYDDSGRVASYWVCNVGDNGREEKIKGDDICRLVNTGTGEPYDLFPGLSPEDAKKYIACANSAVQQASRQRQENSNIDSVRISTNCQRNMKSLKTGEPAANIPSMQCENFMSPDDCKILYNLCDPVICPSSRCDLGGTYPVQDVIQSGIIGSVFLCLPNFVGFGGDVYIPVCLTGIKAGIDGFLSVMTAYRDCLQESLETGKQIGVCDEIHSIYLCDFFWKQGKPLADLIVPKTLEVILNQNSQGGGEYLGVQNAWDTASESMNYFTNYYAGNAFKAFKARATDRVEQEVCKNFMSVDFPTSVDLLDSFTEPDSPAQFHGRFDSMPYTTSTNPPISQYKVYYHIYAGQDTGAYYKVYLKGDAGGTYYQDTGSSRIVANSYVKEGEYASETLDFTAPSGYTELCIVVNNQEQCGFGETSTSYAVNYVKEKYIQEQANKTDIETQEECVSGSASIYQLLNPNMQSMAESAIDPAIYEKGLTRICATKNPGQGTDATKSTWVDVGYCDDINIRCWIDTSNIKDLIKNIGIENDTLKEIEDRALNVLEDDPDAVTTPEKYGDEKKKITNSDDSEPEKIQKKTELLKNLFMNSFKGDLLLERAREYGIIATKEHNNNEKTCQNNCNKKGFDFGEITSKKDCNEKKGVEEGISKSSCQESVDLILNEYIEDFYRENPFSGGERNHMLGLGEMSYVKDDFFCGECDEYDCTNDFCTALGNLGILQSSGEYSCSYEDTLFGGNDCMMLTPLGTGTKAVDYILNYGAGQNKEGVDYSRFDYPVFDYELTDSQENIKKELDNLKNSDILDEEKYNDIMRLLITYDISGLKEKLEKYVECKDSSVVAHATSDDGVVCCCYNEVEDEQTTTSSTSSSSSSSGGGSDSNNENLISRCSEYADLIKKYAGKYGIDAELLMALMIQESGCQNGLEGDDGQSFGLMQIQEASFNEQCSDEINSFEGLKSNAEKNIQCGAIILKSKYNLFRNDCNAGSDCDIYECSVWKSAQCGVNCNEKRCEYRFECGNIKEDYSGWNAALRAYNGWACSSNTVSDYVEEVNSWLNEAKKALNYDKAEETSTREDKKETQDSFLIKTELNQEEDKLILKIENNCKKVEFTIKRKDSGIFSWDWTKGDKIIISTQEITNSGVVREYSLNTGVFEVGKTYYVEAVCSDNNNEVKSEIIISQWETAEKESELNECEKAINGIINKFRKETANNFNKDDYRVSIFALSRYGIDSNDLNDILNSDVEGAIKGLEKLKSEDC